MRNRRSVMVFSALQILLFHLWIYVLKKNEAEIFLKQTAYIGVDIFFLLSGFALAGRKVENCAAFLLSRVKAVYIKFVLFAVVAFIYSSWTFKHLLEVISGVDLLTRGGGAFLWFLPAIMLFYIFYPLFQKCDRKNRPVTLIVVILLWLVIAYLVTNFTAHRQIFIFWNRIPVFLTGYYAANLKTTKKVLDNKLLSLAAGAVLAIAGMVVIYLFAYKTKLQIPFRDMFYVVVIPACLGLTLLVNLIPENKVIKVIGSSTLEMYAVQMIFGYDVANQILKATKNIWITNIGSILFVIISAVAIHYLYGIMVSIPGRIRGENKL